MSRHVQLSFDLYLVNKPGESLDRAALLAQLRRETSLHEDRADPDRYVYHNHDTGVFFTLLLAPGIARRPKRSPYADYTSEEGAEEESGADEESGEGAEENTRESPDESSGEEIGAKAGRDDATRGGAEGTYDAPGPDGTVDAEDGTASSREDEEEKPEAGEDVEAGEDWEPESPHLEVPPVTLSLPYLSPTFFVLEAMLFAARLGTAARLTADHWLGDEETGLEGGEGPPPTHQPLTPDQIVARWLAENNLAYFLQKNPSAIVVWSPQRSSDWWAYGSHRAELEMELAADGVSAPTLQVAQYGDAVKTICVWEVGKPTVLPRCDLVLIRRCRVEKGIFWSRRVTEEGIATGERIWDLLAPFSEIRAKPAEILIFREAAKPPQQVAAELEERRVEPVGNVKRRELFGIVDFEPKPVEESKP